MTRLVTNTARLTRTLLGAFFAVAAVSKARALWVGDFGDDTLFGALATGRLAAGWGVVVFEAVVALMLVWQWLPRVTLVAAVVFLSTATGMLVKEYRSPAPRSCGCLNMSPAEVKPEAVRTELAGSIATNASLLVATLALLATLGRQTDSKPAIYENVLLIAR